MKGYDKMAAVERTYNVPLRKAWLKAPYYKRAKKAVNAVREYLQKHMKSEDVLLGPRLNMKIWEKGITNPPHHVKVTAVKDDKGTVRAELFGFDFKKTEKKQVKKAPKAGGLAGKLQKKLEETKKTEPEAPKDVATKKDLKKDLKKADVSAESKSAAPKTTAQAEMPKTAAKPEAKN